MSKNAKLALFFLGATVFNIVLMIALIAVFFLLARVVPVDSIRVIIILVGFMASIVITFLVYGRVMKWVTVKLELEKNIPQLFKKKK
jgi:hypothetical protein